MATRVRFFKTSTAWAPRLAIATLAGFFLLTANGDAPRRGSAEQLARKAAERYEKEKGFRLRQDFWRGVLSGAKGKAIRLQFFKGNKYRLFLAADAAARAAGIRLHVMVIDKSGNILGESELSKSVATVEVTPRKTGAYMILMRAEFPEGSAHREIPSVLFYGYR